MPRLKQDGEEKPDKKLYDAIKPLAAEIVKLQAQLKAAGMFADDRELLECPKCGLQEDVTAGGKLITCSKELPDEDTGGIFQPLDEGALGTLARSNAPAHRHAEELAKAEVIT